MRPDFIPFEDIEQSCAGIWVDDVDCACEGSHGELTELQRSMLDLEAGQVTYDKGHKTNEIRKLMGPGWQNRYYQLLHHLIKRKIAVEYAPSTVKRLHRLESTPKWKRGAA